MNPTGIASRTASRLVCAISAHPVTRRPARSGPGPPGGSQSMLVACRRVVPPAAPGGKMDDMVPEGMVPEGIADVEPWRDWSTAADGVLRFLHERVGWDVW